jgi:hypothetical protein
MPTSDTDRIKKTSYLSRNYKSQFSFRFSAYSVPYGLYCDIFYLDYKVRFFFVDFGAFFPNILLVILLCMHA